VEGRAARGEAGRAVEQATAGQAGIRLLAEVALVAGAEEALAALGDPGHHHVVADGDVGDALPDLLDHTGALVSEDDRAVREHRAVLHGDVGVADAGGAEADLDLAGVGSLHLDVVSDLERQPGPGEHCGLDHVGLPPARWTCQRMLAPGAAVRQTAPAP
jgi:hypothetical protein